MAEYEETIPENFFSDPEVLMDYMENKVFPMCKKVNGYVWLAVPKGQRKEMLKIIRAYIKHGVIGNSIHNTLKVVEEETLDD